MSKYTRNKGFTLMEAIFLTTIMSIVALGAGVGLQSTVRIPPAADKALAINRQIASAMEQVRATAWASMTVGTTTSNVTINGTSYSQSVTIAAADANGDSVNDADFRQITVAIGSQTQSTYVTQP